MNKYARVRQIGEGAFGKAILVKRKDSARQYVIKEINITKMTAKEREESRKEVAVLAQLKHPNIVCYIESFEEKGSLYIVMNFCAGGDLYGKINERRGVPFQEEQILDWFVQLCLAVKHIHDRKILHRDIKSQNIFLTNSGTVQLGDFGIAKVLNSTAQLAHTCIGTPYYLSPEIVENMPYNNKSDIWSMGCVLYELTTLKHAFEAGNMKNLVLKIIRGSYPPISPQFSYDLRGLIAQLFKRNPRDRPTVNAILKKNFVMQRVRKFLSAQDIEEEFSHTVMHGHKIAKALPPAPKPSADPSKRVNATPRPGSANKKYDPAAVYGAPLSSSKNRMSGEKKRPSTPGRQAPVPGQVDWEKKKKERQELEEKRRAEMRKRDQEVNERRHRELIEKQKVMRMNKAREEGWKHVIDPFSVDENNRAPTPNNNRPLPVPKVNNDNRNRGDYEAYNQFLGRLQQDREAPSPAGRNPNHVDVVHIAVPRPLPAGNQQRPPIPQQFNMGPLGVPIAMGPPGVPAALDQAGRDRQLGAQAAQRARVVEDYMQRKRMADLNKMRAQNDLYGMYRPSSADRRTPVPAPRRGASPGPGRGGGGGGGGGMLGRNREEQEYLEKLRQIRIQNMKDRRAIRGGNVAEHADNKASEDSEERKKKVEALKLQAEQWAEMKKKELEKQRQGIVPVKPATPVPMTGALQAIGALDGAQNAQAGSQGSAGSLTNAMKAVAGTSPESDRPQSAHQMKKDSILKKLNEKNPARGKWKEPASPAVPEEVDRRRWGAPASPAINAAEEEAPESARSQWGAQKNLHLTNVPLELTGSQMEATSVRDQVIKMNAAGGKDKEVGRSQWGRRSDVVRALDKMPISQDTVTINGSPEAPSPAPQGPPSPAPQGPPVGVGSTITIIQKPPGQGAISGEDGKNLQMARRPLPAPPRSGTIVLSHGSIGVSVPVVDESDSAKVDVKTTPTATEAEDKGKLKNDLTRDGAKSVQMNLTSGNFDLRNVKLLRTISEPDLTSLCAAHADESTAKDSLPVTPATLRRHHSLDLTVVPEGDFDEVDNSPLDAQDDEFAEEDILILANDEDNDSDENEGDDEDDDIRSMRETMQSIIDNSDEEEKDKTLVSLQTSGSETSNKKEHAKKKSRASKKTEEAQNEQPANSKDEEEEEKADDGDDERNDDSDEANLQKQTLADVLKLENEDSDEDSTFGDDDQDGGKGYDDRFGRLEQLRKELETALGVNKLVEVYQVIQKFQEDDEGNIEDGAKEAIKILGASREHLFPKIFQLVMSDTAFQEDNS